MPSRSVINITFDFEEIQRLFFAIFWRLIGVIQVGAAGDRNALLMGRKSLLADLQETTCWQSDV
jgi:hypothetical protein